MLLRDLDEISKVIGSAVVTENEQIEGNYAYNDENIGMYNAILNAMEPIYINALFPCRNLIFLVMLLYLLLFYA